LSGVPDDSGGFTPVPAGKYDAIVDSVEYGLSKNKNRMLTWKFAIENEGQRRVLWYHTPFTEKTLPRLKSTLVAVNPDLNLSAFHPRNDLPLLIGQPCQIVVAVKTYE